ncbi:cell division protein FtsQ/DivIB [Henriciella marina]|uniref:Cell division protein FtsQ/DivIB n=1 Tax=Henriciella marina TaxID=453851 RepID=A0ABT4LW45_9PROT|nr:cell division protein FtsQ/DivIB [Henriciella marina]MCZ4298596.1 cell division protein FtsQ/DivIB [Henriciella marina]
MPKVKGQPKQGQRTRPQPRKRAPAPVPVEPARADLTSVLTGFVMVVALIVAGAALLGGSMSKVSDGVGNAFDSAATGLGFAVEDVQITGLGSDVRRASLVQQMSGVAPGDNMFRADPHEIRRQVLATGQVTSAHVYRLWPNQILINASPAKASAIWYDGDGQQVVDSTGQIMEGLSARDYSELVLLTGVDAPEGVPALLQFLARADTVRDRVSYAERVSRRRWDVKLRDGLLIRLPADASVKRATDELIALENATDLSQRSLTRIDLRVAGRTFLEPLDEQGASGTAAES